MPQPIASARVLGVQVDGWTAESLIEAMVATAAGRPGPGHLSTVLYANPHVLNLAYRNRALREELERASTVYCDGAGVVFAASLLGQPIPPRLTAADWIDPLCDATEEAGISLFLVGGKPGVAQEAARRLTRTRPGLRIAGTHHGYVDEESSHELIRRVNDSGAALLVVGMGTPIQELWIGRHRNKIEAPVVWAVGALMDFVAGTQRRAPEWLRRIHLEWLWRLGTDPIRLGRRYVAGNPAFLGRVLRQRVGGRTGPAPHRSDG